MGKIAFLIFSFTCIYAGQNTIDRCNKCHNNFSAPPYQKIYSKYILYHGSKTRVKKAMILFLEMPSKEKSIMPMGMKRRFNPDEHPKYKPHESKDAVEYLVESEDFIKKFD